MVVTGSDRIGGAQVHVRDLARALWNRGFEVTVLTGPGGPFTEELRRAGIPYCTLHHLARPISPPADARAILELQRALKTLAPDLIAVHSSKAGWIGRLVARRLGIPCVFTVHGWPFGSHPAEPGGTGGAGIGEGSGRARAPGGPGVPGGVDGWAGFYLVAERLLKGLADRVITVCEHDRALGLRLGVLAPDRAVLIPSGVPDVAPSLRAHPGRPGRPANPTRLVMVSRFEEPKDHTTLLRAMAAVEVDVSWRLDLVGDGPGQAPAEALARELGLRDRVHFHGARRDVERVLAAAQVFVLSTRREGLPLAILEAMRAGLPVVASGVGGVAEAVADGETGFVVPPGDVAAWAGRLRRLLVDPALRARMGRAGRKRYEERFTLERMVDETVAVYEAVLSSAKARAPRRQPQGAAAWSGGDLAEGRRAGWSSTRSRWR